MRKGLINMVTSNKVLGAFTSKPYFEIRLLVVINFLYIHFSEMKNKHVFSETRIYLFKIEREKFKELARCMRKNVR